MKLRQLHTTLLLSLCALPACSDQDVVTKTDNEKCVIELTVGGVDTPETATRTVITDGTNKTKHAFKENTSLYMLMKSDNLSDVSKPSLVTRTIMFALPETDESKDTSSVNYSASGEYSKFVRYWDDAYARNAALSILAVCTPGMGAGVDKKAWNISGSDAGYANRNWETISTGSGTTPYTSISWPVGNSSQYSTYKLDNDQSILWENVSFIKNQDLCFSNNIGNWSGKGGADRRLKFDPTTKKFPRSTDLWEGTEIRKTQMIFYHALSKLTFRIKKGEGFTDSEFKFNNNTNIKLTNFYNKGTFNIEEGEFISSTITSSDINKIYLHPSLSTEETDAGYKYILDALVIPGTDLSTSNDAVSFYINNNQYKLTRAQLFEAFTDAQKNDYFDSKKLKAGVHYVFTFTIGKTKIKDITASVVDWEEVTAENITPSNARIKLLLEERGKAQSSDVAFWKKEDNKTTDGIDDDYATYNWGSGYANMNATYDSEEGHWTTSLFWNSSKDFYHFRALMPAATAVTSDPTGGDYATLTSSVSYTDIRWGAPMKDDGDNETEGSFKWTYDPVNNYGFDNTNHTQIYKAIGPTEDSVKLILFHMMSDLTFNIKTTTGSDKVKLVDGETKTKIEIVNFYPDGKVLLGNGLVETTGTGPGTKEVAWDSEAPSGTHTYKYGVVPQTLTGVQLRITTPDNNEYIVDLSKVLAASTTTTNNIANPYKTIQSGDNAGKYQIDRWYPGFKYTYSFTLKKTGITNLEATIVDWENVTAEDETVVIQ